MPGPADARLVGLLDSSSLTDRMTINMYQVSMLVAKVRAATSSTVDNLLLDGFLYAFAEIEHQHVQWEQDAMVLIGYKKEIWPEKATGSYLPVPSCYHIYPGIWSTGIWNKHRAARIILHQTFLEVFSSATVGGACSSESRDWSAISRSIIQNMIKDILSSVPFSLGDVPTSDTTGCPMSVGGYFLVWVLQVIIRCSFASTEQKCATRSILLRIGRLCGISYATVIAQN
jgi:hypothetical protein